MSYSTLRCDQGHEWHGLKVPPWCPYPRCDGTPVAVKGPLAPKKDKAK